MTNQVANNQVQTFNGIFGQVRIIVQENGNGDEQVFFVGKDVAEALGYIDTDQALRKHVDDEDKLTRQIDGGGQARNAIIINESGVYSLVFASKLPTAKQFKRWVTSEVLPAIRKHGGYLTPASVEQALTDPDFIIRMATKLKEERQARLIAEQQVTKLTPKADYYDAYMNREETHSVTSIAQCLGWSGNQLFAKLREMGWLTKPVGCPHQITKDAPEGIFKMVKSCFTSGTRGEQLRVTNKGFQTIIEMFQQ